MNSQDEDFIRFYRDAGHRRSRRSRSGNDASLQPLPDYTVRLLNETIAGCEGQDIRNWKPGNARRSYAPSPELRPTLQKLSLLH